MSAPLTRGGKGAVLATLGTPAPTAVPPGKPRSNLSLKIDAELHTRMRAIYRRLAISDDDLGPFADLVERAIRIGVESLEAEYNNGEPFETGGGPLRRR